MPAQRSPETGELSCPRCTAALLRAGRADSTMAAALAGEGEAPEAAPPRFDPWEFDEQLRHVGRRLRLDGEGSGPVKDEVQREFARLDPPHGAAPAWHVPKTQTKSHRRKKRQRTAGRRSGGVLAWTALAMGTMVLVCGAMLLVWAVVADRGELWAIGLPAAFVGQVVLLVGLVLQLDRLWRDNRSAAARLKHVDVQLHELRATTTLMGTSGASPGSAFYSHLAGGASPHLLLNDLKGQLDLLAMKLSREP
ncbi:MAG: hypothetical protein ACOCWL_00980 [Thermoguttaceae bacterium]